MKKRTLLHSMIAACGAALTLAGLAQAATYTVSNTNDTGAGSLRQALTDALGAAGPHDIQAGGVVGTISLQSALPTITNKTITIHGPTSGTLTVTRGVGANFRLFTVTNSGGAASLTLNRLTLTNGAATADLSANPDGGGIGVFNAGLNMNFCTVSGCSAGGDGGGVVLLGSTTTTSATMNFCTFSGNTANRGGGISCLLSAGPGTLNMNNCTVSGNTVASNAGGVNLTFSNGTFRNCTISSNTANTSNGGGLMVGSGGSLSLLNCTVTNNRVVTGGAIGGGIRSLGSAPVTLTNTLMVGNFTGVGSTADDVSWSANTSKVAKNSVVGADVSGVGFATVTSSQIGTQASPKVVNLGALASNGGPTQTHALLPSAPELAINFGSNSDVTSIPSDQRGTGYDRVMGGTVDIGAFETGTAAPTFTGVSPLGAPATSHGAGALTLSNFTVPPGDNRLLVVVASDTNSLDVTSASFGGTAMTQSVERNDGFAVDSIWVLPLGTATTATTGNITVTRSGTGDFTFIAAQVFQNVHQTTPVSATDSFDTSLNATSISRNIASAVGDLVFDVFDTYRTASLPTLAPAVSNGQAVVHSAGSAIGVGFDSYKTSIKPGAATVNMSWTTSSEDTLYLAVNLKQAPGGGAPEIAVTETGVGNVADGGSFSFGTTTVGTPVTKTFTVTNSGTSDLTLSGLSAPSGFSIAQNFASSTVTPSNSTTFQITMLAAAPGTPSGTLTFANNDSDENPYNFTISGTVNSPPVITLNPASQTVAPGGLATFTAAATGTPTPTAQWQRSTDGGANFINMVGATLTTLSFTTSSFDNGYQYRAVFTNAAGSVPTTAATLTVAAAPVITLNPSNQTVNAGGMATFTAAATGTPTPTIQWQEKVGAGSFTNITNGGVYSGATAGTLTITGATVGMSTNQYRAVFTNTVSSATSNAATLTVNAINLSINDVSLTEGNAGTSSFTFTVSLSQPAGAGGVTFDIATADGTATQPGDYTQNSLTAQTIPAGSSTYSFTVLVNGDTSLEANETFFVNVTNVTGASVTDNQGQGTITNDDLPKVSIAATTPTAVEGGATGLHTFTREGSSGDLMVNFQLDASSTATAGSDFTLSSSQALTFNTGTGAGTIVIPNGATTATITLTAVVEAVNAAEAAETARLNVTTGAGYTPAPSPNDNATVTIAANSFLVTTTADSGTGSLRQAVLNANAISGTDTITFSDGTGGTVNFTDATLDTITLTTGEISITSQLAVSGTGATKLAVSGNAASRIFLVNIGANLTLDQLTLTNGRVSGPPSPYGGAVRNLGTLRISRCVLSGNYGQNAGGAISNENSAQLVVIGSTFASNVSPHAGGAVINLNNAQATIIDSTLSGNSATGPGDGGGIYSSFSTLTLVNSTVSGNTADGSIGGGGLYCNGGSATLTNCTVTGNSMSSGNANSGGGGIQAANNATIVLNNTIVIGNSATVNGSPETSRADCSRHHPATDGSIYTGNFALTGLGTGGPTGGTNLNIASAAAVLNTTLANNGGPTQTHALVAGSPAINAGSNALLPVDTFDVDGDSNTTEVIDVDQRGTGFIRAIGTVDIGAFEVQLPAISIAATTPTAVEGGTTGLYTFTRQGSTGALTVNFQLDAGSTATAGTDFNLTSSGTLTFTAGSGAGTIVIPDGSTTATVTLTALTETPNGAEAAETARLNIVTGSGYVLAATPNDNATVTITENSFLVTTTADSGTGSLRQAILNANSIAGIDTVTFSDGTGGTTNFTDATADTITLTSGELAVASNVTIVGPGEGKLAISGNRLSRVFYVTGAFTFELSGAEVKEGSAVTGTNRGGGISNENGGTVKLTHCTVSESFASIAGGGVHQDGGGSLTLTDCRLIANSSNDGGAITVVSGTATIQRCTIDNNTASSSGGGVTVRSPAIVSMRDCLVSNNTVTDNLGIASAIGSGGTLTMENCTVSKNRHTGGVTGGAIHVTGGHLTLRSCTVTDNSDSSNLPPYLGGILVYSGSTCTLMNTIVAGNISPSIPPDLGVDVNGPLTADSANNFIGDGHGVTGIANGSNGNQIGTTNAPLNALLGPLADNGGPTMTHALLSGSPAINAGSNALLSADTFDLDGDTNTSEPIPFDQRGTGYPRAIGTVDIGAFEVQASPEIEVTEAGVGNVADGGSFSFGTTTVGTLVAKTFTVTNSGTAPLNLSGLLAPAGFIVSQDFGTNTVAPGGGTTTFQVTMLAVAVSTPSGTLTFTTDDADENPYTFTISGTVNPAPAAPVADDQNLTTPVDTPLAITLTATDANLDPLTYSIVTPPAPAEGSLSGAAPNVTFTPAVGFAGITAFSFRANDGALDSNEATIIINVIATPGTDTLVNTGADQPPGAPIGAQFLNIRPTAKINAGGHLAFRAWLRVGTGGVTSGGDTGIWAHDTSGTLQLVALEGTSAPGTADNFGSIDNNPAWADDGSIAYSASLLVDHSGIWKGATLVAKGNSALPDGSGEVFANLAQPVLMNNAGHLAFKAQLKVGAGGVTGSTDEVILSSASGSLKTIAREGSAAPGASGGTFFKLTTFPDWIAQDQSGRTLFVGQLTNRATAPVITANNSRGLWIDDGSTTSLVIRGGDLAAGMTTELYYQPGYPVISQGRIAFHSVLRGPTVTAGVNDAAVFAGTPGGDLTVMARTGVATGPGAPADASSTAFSKVGYPRIGMGAAPTTAIRGELKVGTGGVTLDDNEGIWKKTDGGAVSLVVRENAPAPGLGGAVFGTLGEPFVGENGLILFSSLLRGAGVSAANDASLWVQLGDGSLKLLLRQGQTIATAYGAEVLSDLHTPLSGLTNIYSEAPRIMNLSGQTVVTIPFLDGNWGLLVLDI